MGGAMFKRTSLKDADLQGAYLRVATFDSTDLSGADLRGARWLTTEQIRCTIRDSDTRLPDYLIAEPGDGH
jgi:uncharacterized protein YjbI with pentapeptide repeats